MTPANLLQLIALAAIWGASFLFMRIAVPVLGPVWLIEWRVLLAALLLALAARWFRRGLDLRAHGRHYLVLGLFNTALPFVLFAWAAQTLTASLLSIFNATAPIWGALIARVWGRTPLSPRNILGLLLGVAGVALIVGLDGAMLQPGAGAAMVAALLAPLCYGIASYYARAVGPIEPFDAAHGSMWAATLLLAPALLWVPFTPLPLGTGVSVWAAVVALGLLCTGVAYLLYFRLVVDLGAASALTVTFLIPVFGILWGYLFLGEAVGWHTLTGALVVLSGTALVTGFQPRTFFMKKGSHRG